MTTISQNKFYQLLGRRLEWPIAPQRHADALARGIQVFKYKEIKKHALSLLGQPFDSDLLRFSKLYRKSRKSYLEGGGKFHSMFVGSARSLSSPILLEQRIEYSPIERELIFAASDLIQKKNLEYLLELRTYSSSVFHEQSHRILWRLLPPPPRPGKDGALRRYLNFAESLVIATDMALGDELGPRVAPFFYLLGVTYDPGTTLKREGLSKREYRNYLQAVVLGTYMTLELYSKKGIDRAIAASFPGLGSLGVRASRRSQKLDVQFVTTTNENWQRRYSGLLFKTLGKTGKAPLILSDNPIKNPEQYLIAEKWFEKMGL